ncbi:MAG TPA: hypothetical protein VK465_02435 [Fibrobacteria bacterium]|nr:hypothetical protein [Fibrobacteria bacterium]
MKTKRQTKIVQAELQGEIDLYLGNNQNPYPAGTDEASAWLDGQCEGLMNSDETYLEWKDAHASGIPKEATPREEFILGLVQAGKLTLLDSLLQGEKPRASGDYWLQFRIEGQVQSERHRIVLYRYRGRRLVYHTIPGIPQLLFLENPLLNGCVWTRVEAI